MFFFSVISGAKNKSPCCASRTKICSHVQLSEVLDVDAATAGGADGALVQLGTSVQQHNLLPHHKQQLNQPSDFFDKFPEQQQHPFYLQQHILERDSARGQHFGGQHVARLRGDRANDDGRHRVAAVRRRDQAVAGLLDQDGRRAGGGAGECHRLPHRDLSHRRPFCTQESSQLTLMRWPI